MTLQDLSLRYNQRQRIITAQAQKAARQMWGTVDPGNIADSWVRNLPNAVQMMQAGKTASATGASDYVTASLAQQGAQSETAGVVIPSAFSQAATDGRPLGSLLYTPVVGTQARQAAGMPAEQALAGGLKDLEAIVGTEIADAGRQAVSVAMKADRRVAGYYREVGAGACARCAILAGKWFASYQSANFERHPRCQCTAVAAAREGSRNPTGFSPERYFASLSRADQDRIFGAEAAQAIRDGADMAQVVNASRGMSEVGSWTTTEGTTRSGYYGGHTARGINGKPRLTPESIYRLAANRDEAIELLVEYGYLLPGRAPALQVALDQQRAEQLLAAQKAAEQKAAEEKAAEQKAAEEKAAARSVRDLSDDELAAELATGDEQRIDEVIAELDRRDAAAKKAAQDKARRDAKREAKQAAQDAEYERLIEEGVDPEDAFAEAYGVDQEQQRRDAAIAQLRSLGYHGDNFDQLSRDAFRDEADRQYFDAEDSTRGNVLNAAGKAAGVDPRTLFVGTEARARKYASEELLQWWQDNGRLTLDNFQAGMLGGKVEGPRGGYWL